jgi:hypothetical protein
MDDSTKLKYWNSVRIAACTGPARIAADKQSSIYVHVLVLYKVADSTHLRLANFTQQDAAGAY